MELEQIKQLFENLGNGNGDKFFEQVSDQVNWTVYGQHPTAGVFKSKQQFLAATIEKLQPLLKNDTISLDLVQIHISGDTAIAELLADTYSKKGNHFFNHYCWVCRFEDDKIVQVKEYLDSVAIRDLFEFQ